MQRVVYITLLQQSLQVRYKSEHRLNNDQGITQIERDKQECDIFL